MISLALNCPEFAIRVEFGSMVYYESGKTEDGGGHRSDMSAFLSILWFTSRSSVVCMCNGGK